MITIRVPATSANIGSGFDCLGLALPLCNEVRAKRSERLIIHTDVGLPTDANNLIIRSMNKALDRMMAPHFNVEMWQTNNIPSTSGMGSSAACIVAGIVMANELIDDCYKDRCMSQQDMLDLACELDGHPDNTTAALLGGITAAIEYDGYVTAFSVPNPHRWKVAMVTPDFPFSTKEARAVLPKHYSRKDVVTTLSCAVTTFAALSFGDAKKLKFTLKDCFHEPYRLPLIKGAIGIIENLHALGAYGVFLSGAGPTIGAFIPDDFEFAAPNHWTCRIMDVSTKGVEIINS